MGGVRTFSRRVRAGLRRFHHDERGDALEYLLVLGVFSIPMIALMDKIKDIMREYFAMIAFFVGWPFL